MKIQVKRLTETAKLPRRTHPGDAGADLYVDRFGLVSIPERKRSFQIIHTGIAVAIPEGYVGLLFPRSSINKKDVRLSNAVGVIDSGYRGEIIAVFDMTGRGTDYYVKGERCCQLLIVPVELATFEEVNELPPSDRGEGGFGSTGN